MTGLRDDRDPSGRFVRGLTLGALLGAVIAGSSIWTRARARRRLAGHGAPVTAETPVPSVTAPEAPPPDEALPPGEALPPDEAEH